jgi:hypothetical protein
MSTRHTTRGSRAFWIALLILLPLPLGALSGFFAYYHYILGVGSAAAGYWSLGGLAVALVWAMRLIDLAKKDISFEPSDWAWEAAPEPEYYPINPATGFRMTRSVYRQGSKRHRSGIALDIASLGAPRA